MFTSSKRLLTIPGILGLSGIGLTYIHTEEDSNVKKSKNVYSREEVSKHKTAETGIWVTYKNSVYDVTDFVESHPGGERNIMLAAGSAVDPFWKMYQQHTTSKVLDLLEPMCIGELEEMEEREQCNDADDPYENDPKRSNLLCVRKDKPFNAETPLSILRSSYLTPTDLWYVRHHHPVPTIDESTYVLTVKDMKNQCQTFTLEDLKKLPKEEIICTIQCAGNRRSEFGSNVQGLAWTSGAISTAKFGGIWLKDLVDLSDTSIKHVQMLAHDAPYDASVPCRRKNDVFLCYEMNGEPLDREHGYPLRSITPGVLGARNVKWLTDIVLSDQEAESTWQRGAAYKVLPSYVKDLSTVNAQTLPSIQELPVQSIICTTEYDEEDNTMEIEGIAWSGGGRNIIRVDISSDGGSTWQPTVLEEGCDQEDGKAWAWIFWRATIKVDKGQQHSLCCKAIDNSQNTQPAHPDIIWNIRGILNNSWHTINIKII